MIPQTLLRRRTVGVLVPDEPEPGVSVVAGDAGTCRDAHPAQPLLVVEKANSSYRIDHEWSFSHPRTSKTCAWVEGAT